MAGRGRRNDIEVVTAGIGKGQEKWGKASGNQKPGQEQKANTIRRRKTTRIAFRGGAGLMKKRIYLILEFDQMLPIWSCVEMVTRRLI